MQDDVNPEETREWLEALKSVIDVEGIERAHYIIGRLQNNAIRDGHYLSSAAVNTPYCNTIPPQNEERMPGDMFMERQIRGYVRWNALAMVMRANKRNLNGLTAAADTLIGHWPFAARIGSILMQLPYTRCDRCHNY